MKNTFLMILLLVKIASSQTSLSYDDYFLETTMRVDLFFTGDAREEIVTLDQIYQEGPWPENPHALLEPFNYGAYVYKVYDIASNQLIFRKSFSSMFAEYRTTTPALNGIKRVFDKSVRFPFPRRSVLFVLESRDKKNLLHPIFTLAIVPSDYHINKESPSQDIVHPVLQNGAPGVCVDLVFLGEGYTANERKKFEADAARFAGYLFDIEPYKSHKNRFNIVGVLRPSPESAMDEPRQGSYKSTALNASFNAFDTDRYMLTQENRRIHDIAAQVPYDAIVVLVNSQRYGGGGIYNDYAITTVDHRASKMVFIHELGHSFAGLADEYYSSDVAYNDMYPKGVEPLEPNITALLDPANVKWKAFLTPGIAVPTPYGKDEIEALQEEHRKNPDQGSGIDARIKAIREKYADLADKVGVFEGAGYSAKGLYRPMMYCIMISNPKNEFCAVCQDAIARMIGYYAPRK